jgi:hypothetical protein
MKPEKSKKIEEILASLDGIRPATAPSFFYTRLKARMEAGLVKKESRPLLLRPVYILATIMVVLLMNALVVLNSGSGEGNEISEQETEQSIAAEYNINTNLTYEINQ